MSFSGDLYPSVASKVMTTTGDLVRYDSQEIDRLVEYVKACDKAGLSTPEIHPLEDK